MRIPGSFSSGVWYQPGYYEHSKIQRLLPIDDPALDSVEAQRMMQRLLADKINSYADIDELRLLLVSGAQADGVVTQGLTPLHYACHRDYLGAAKLLLVRGAKVNAVDDAGYSPLHLCAEKGNYRLLKLLLQYMARVCYVDPKDAKKEFPLRESVDEPLRMAIRRGHYECARLLLDNGADPNAKYFDGPEITHVSPLDTHFLRLLAWWGNSINAKEGFIEALSKFSSKRESPATISCCFPAARPLVRFFLVGKNNNECAQQGNSRK
ncbi:ankyrin repeats (3 copies) domain-containing protein [Ditylenchus destructor]|uniref:Ankyrin repeats (3 copies) domain-containing protein n=1 Tax=Ditylenchus destructor TaxID=166010 RepID=A0AAD4MPQ0_9BILA|nr:ankyrin repeats (3 copies) domain-containing protein [Ditylenchus destructor]